MCSPTGALQFAFGQTGVPGSSPLESTYGRGLVLPAALNPFTKAQPRATEWSGQFMEMVYSFETADEDAAFDLLDELGWQLEDAGWVGSAIERDNYPVYLVGYDGRMFEQSAGHTRVLIGLDYALREISLSCGRDDLLRTHAEEVFGNLPSGTPRPSVPAIAAPIVASAAECESEAAQVEARALIESGGHSGFMATMLARTTHRDRLTEWMLWKLDQSGTLTPQELVALSFSAVGDASPGGNPLAAFSMIEEMFPLIDSLDAAHLANDPAAMCRALIEFHSWVGRVDAITLAQTQALHTRLEAEAARLGVSLE